MERKKLEPGLRVKVAWTGSIDGVFISHDYLKGRCAGVLGTVTACVPGHGGDLWLVRHHKSNIIAAYVFTELEPIIKRIKAHV